MDEGAEIHEAIGSNFERYLTAEGFLYFMWVVPYGIGVVVIGLVFLRFVWGLPEHIRTYFIASGVIYLTGVIGIEMFGAREAYLHGTETVLYCVLYSLEEMLEMLGIVLFMYALLLHLTEETGRVTVTLELAHGSPSPAGADDDAHER